VEEAISIVDSQVEETGEDFAELIKATIENKRPTEETIVVEGVIDREEYSIRAGTEFNTFNTTIPAETHTNSRAVDVSPESTETVFVKIPTGVWEFAGDLKLRGDIEMQYDHETTLIKNPDELPEMESHELVSITEADVNFENAQVVITGTIENFSDDPLDNTIVGTLQDMDGEPTTEENEIRLRPGQKTNFELSIFSGNLNTPGYRFVEIAGVREDPGSDPGFTSLVEDSRF
jgi:hypothetical protein